VTKTGYEKIMSNNNQIVVIIPAVKRSHKKANNLYHYADEGISKK
jgi:hypothetical protein